MEISKWNKLIIPRGGNPYNEMNSRAEELIK
jgi:hypothetical protein